MLSDKRKRVGQVVQKSLTCVILLAVCYLLWYQYDSRQSRGKYEQLVSMLEEGTDGAEQGETTDVYMNVDADARIKKPLACYQALYQVNQDMVGWLEIEGTELAYPVVQTKDNSYYLNHDFYGVQDRHGCIFADTNCQIDGGNHIMLYGHHMKDGSMFAALDSYKEESYYEQHKQIQFNTLYEARTYEIMAVFTSKAYAYPDISSEKAFQPYLEEIQQAAWYPTQVSATYGDELLTLVTCSYHTEDGRLIIVAKRVA